MPSSRPAPETFDQWVGAVIEGRMKKRGKRQRDLANETGIPFTLIGRVIRGERHITVREFELVAGVLKYTAAEMLTEALEEYGGMEKLLAEYGPVSEPTATVDPSESIPYIGPVTPPANVAASERPQED